MKKEKNQMSIYVVIDLEMCNVPRSCRHSYSYGNEIIQIGAVLMNENFEVVDEFSSFVAPRFGALDNEISNLTGIKGVNLKTAPPFEEALALFLQWVPDDASMVEWSDNDRIQLKAESSRKGNGTVKLEYFLASSIDCQKMFGEKLDLGRRCKLEEALFMADVCEDTRLHNALSDARNTAKLFSKLMTENTLILNPYYREARKQETKHLCVSFGDLLARINLQPSYV